MTLPNFDRIGELLESAPPIEMAIMPGRAFILVAQLQVALRHPDNNGSSAEIARDMARRLQAKLGEIHPEFDVSREEFEDLMEEEG